MKRAFKSLAAVYLLFAAIGHFVEGMGAVDGGCADDCWCQRPVLSIFAGFSLGTPRSVTL